MSILQRVPAVSQQQPTRVLVCGTRATVRLADGSYRVACATCGKLGVVIHSKETAMRAMTRDSAKACPACGAS